MPYTIYFRSATAKGALVNVLRFREQNGKLIMLLDKLPVKRERFIRSMRAFEAQIHELETNGTNVISLTADEYRIVRQGMVLPLVGAKL